MNPIRLVMQWQHAFGIKFNYFPEFSSKEQFELQMKLLKEEIKETIDSFEKQDMVEFLDGLCDITFIVNGLVSQNGLQNIFHNAFMEVANSNMSKLDKDGKPVIGEDGKILKSELFKAPELGKLLELEAENKKRHAAFEEFLAYQSEFQEFLKAKEEVTELINDVENESNG